MNIASNYHHLALNNKKFNQVTKEVKSNLNYSNPINPEYNPSFSGLFPVIEQPKNIRYTSKDCQMEPYKPYLISNDTVLRLGDNFILDFQKDEPITNRINNLKPGESLILGREGVVCQGMDDTVSRKHLSIRRNFKRELIAEDLDSTNGTKICKNLVVPDTSKGSFELKPHVKYILPENTLLQLGPHSNLSLYDFWEQIKNLTEEQAIIVGRSPSATISIEDDYVSYNHLKIKKCTEGIIVEDLGSTNGTVFNGLEEVISYVEDYSRIRNKTYLLKNTPTLIPNDCQLYLGNNFTIDVRNPNILDLLDEKGSVVIGKNESCDLVVDDFYDYTSGKHLKLEKAGNKIVATDLGSTNGTQVIPKNKIEPFYCDIGEIELKQGNVEDCYLLSTIYAMSRNSYGQKLLKDMVRVDESGNYIVTFYGKKPILVAPNELDGQKRGDREKISVSGDLGIKAIERAYGKMLKAKTFMSGSVATMFCRIDDGGWMNEALEKMTNLSCERRKVAGINIERTLTTFSHSKDKYILTCSTYYQGKYGKDKDYVDPQLQFVSNHAYAIEKIDVKNEKITIINPHDTRKSYTISWSDFGKYFDYICYADVSN